MAGLVHNEQPIVLFEKVRLSVMNLAKTESGAHTSVFSLAILSGAAGITIAEYMPNILSEGAGFIIGFILGFSVFSFVAYFIYSRPEMPRLDIEGESETVRELFTQLTVELMKTKRGRAEWK